MPYSVRHGGWIERNDLITPAADINGRNGWMVFTQKGQRTSSTADFARLKEALCPFCKPA